MSESTQQPLFEDSGDESVQQSPKTSKVESSEIVGKALDYLALQRSPDRTVKLLMGKFGVSQKKAGQCVKLAIELAKKGASEYLEAVGTTMLAALQRLYISAFAKEDYAVCLKILQEIKTLLPAGQVDENKADLTVEFVHSYVPAT